MLCFLEALWWSGIQVACIALCLLIHYCPQVDPSEVWLCDECDGTAYFPQDGHFNLHGANLSTFQLLIVEGPEIGVQRTSHPRHPSSISVTSTPNPTSLPPPTFRSVTATRRGPSFSLKVVKASMQRQGRGKPEFQATSQTYVELTEATANIEHILGVICSRWGSEYTLVTNDGLEIEDSTATQCMHV